MIGKAEGIVVRTTDYGEANKILTVYTREAGKVSMMARGAKKSKSRFTAVSQLFTYGYFLYRVGSGMGSLQQGDLINSFRAVREDLTKTAYAVYLAELLDRLTEDKEPNQYLFDMMLYALKWMEEGKDPDIIARLFEMKMLYVAGCRPQFDVCRGCGVEEAPFFVSIHEGGFVCQSCQRDDPSLMAVSSGTVRILRLLQHINMPQLGNVSVKPETKEQLRCVLYAFFEDCTGLYLKSRRFLDQIEQMGLSPVSEQAQNES
ncbi:DNA repair protein RecO [Aneurinibacillus migulanus]|uniref:DNA repair protein RecO n=1 Tax=Aneurinibacillus migulanus TaxID=47500 RepID=A0A0D1XX31_ANEMI|nr:DNA repair protein RecO [Aneurinibacillus migulanus]KIV56663.1 DNA recombination protein RecO [Aneurinibacillus migulanus]KON95426.1 DNA recombination protein RecO [Aneurinibacillus migulanus]MED0893614.1 DNA repair protein RecO [Aneurinibacillus migulanus]MED1617882.1 DNA repair protein RecO [Aneurinibacillus migulanus]SDI69444.1 DNA replication and repair protein RecO [Aneurinibacillus migulanus]